MSPFIEIGKHLNIYDYCNLRLVNKEASHYLKVRDKLKEYNFYINSKNIYHYTNIIKTILFSFKVDVLNIELTNDIIVVSGNLNKFFSIKIPKTSFINYYFNSSNILLKISIEKLKVISNYIEEYDKLFIFQDKKNKNIINLIVSNNFNKYQNITISL